MNIADATKNTFPDRTRTASDPMATLTAEVVRAYVAGNKLPASDLPSLIKTVSEALTSAGQPEPEAKREPAVPIRKSVQDDQIFCLECGKPQKALKRHLTSAHDLAPDEYREKWSLPRDYPMTAPAYSAKRSELAKTLGLGRKPKSEAEPQPEPEPVKKPRKASAKSGEKTDSPASRKRRNAPEAATPDGDR